MSVKRLMGLIAEKDNPTVAGLDPQVSMIPQFMRDEATQKFSGFEAYEHMVWSYNKALIDALHDIVPAIKPQSAFYEAFGWQGVRALSRTVAYAKKMGLYVIMDGKRNDIGSSAAAYASAYLGSSKMPSRGSSRAFEADALTVNPYIGTDGIEPFLAHCREDSMIFVLAKTSNPSSGEYQDVLIDGVPLYRRVAERIEQYGADCMTDTGYSNVGAVVGATYHAQLGELRAAAPHTFFLVPGYGAQGGGAGDVAPAFDKNGGGAIVNSSRAIYGAWIKEGCDPRDFAGAARREAIRMRDALRVVRA